MWTVPTNYAATKEYALMVRTLL